MTRPQRLLLPVSPSRVIASVLAIACSTTGRALAQEWRSGVTVSSSGEVVSNPYLDETTSRTTGAVTLEARPAVWYNGDNTQARIEGYVRARQFFARYGLQDDYGVTATITRRVNEQTSVSAFAGADFIKGRLGSAPQAGPTPVGSAPLPDPAFGQLPNEDPSLIGLRGRTKSYRAGYSVNHRFNERNQLDLSASFQSINFNSSIAHDYTIYDVQGRYMTLISERTSIGVSGGWQKSDYRGTTVGDGRVGTALVTASHQINDRWSLEASAGAAFTKTVGLIPGTGIKATTISIDATLCNKETRGSLCLSYSRRPQPTGLGGLINSDALRLEFHRRVDERNAVSVGGAFSRSDPRGNLLGVLPLIKYATANVRVDHRFNQRLSGFVGTSWGHSYRSDLRIRSNASANVGIYVRLGNLQ